MKTKPNKTIARRAKPSAIGLEEAATIPGIGITIPVRVAKAKLSAVLEVVAGGQQVTITCGGLPKAVLSPVSAERGRKVFMGMGDYLLKQPIHRGLSADEILREEHLSRG